MTECNPFLTSRFDLAFLFASGLHRTQCRKGTNVPYISHLMAVSALVLEAGGDEDLAIAALLHDAAEDQGGQAILDDIRRLFGNRVADVVRECSDTLLDPKPPSEQRKADYLIHLGKASPDALLVSAADKLHNARAILFDYREEGEQVFARFNVGKEGQLDYYSRLFDSFTKRCKELEESRVSGTKRLVAELGRVVEKLKTCGGKHGMLARRHEPSPEEIERHLREAKIVKMEPILAGTAYWGRAEGEFANAISDEKDPKRKKAMSRRYKELAVQLKDLSRNEREQILLEEITKWKKRAQKGRSADRANHEKD